MRIAVVVALAMSAIFFAPVAARGGTRGSDELFWLPTFDQALEMARHTGRPIFLMYYTLVDERAATFSGKGTVC